ncbi:ComEA family DNA-binding protein [Hymenobacter coccineus]|uniref:ComEA family DNA-binding protein n=1 Tax=Hymenobacter coccineus TaxID=1908235 RepID=UPI000A43B1E7|nr:helix-hairpin-helix domain-containing protein [Hymenobacter coccineus]
MGRFSPWLTGPQRNWRPGTWCSKRSLAGIFALIFNLSFLIFNSNPAHAQDYPRRPPDLDRLTQELFAEIQSDQVPVEDIYETLLNYYQAPVNLNAATREDLRALLLLSETQITNLLRHRETNGLLLSVYELQSIEGFDLRTIGRVLPFVAVAGGDGRAARGPLWQRILHEDNNYALLRYERVLQTRQGYTAPTLYQGQPTLRYLGAPRSWPCATGPATARISAWAFRSKKTPASPGPGSRARAAWGSITFRRTWFCKRAAAGKPSPWATTSCNSGRGCCSRRASRWARARR